MPTIREAIFELLNSFNLLVGPETARFQIGSAWHFRLHYIYAGNFPQTCDDLLEEFDLRRRKPREIEKLLRIDQMSAVFDALATHDGQKIIWMSDNPPKLIGRPQGRFTITA